MNDGRITLLPSQTVAVWDSETARINGKAPVNIFTVKKELGRGGSFCVYSVVDDKGNNGTLKEYYPYRLKDLFSRSDDGSLLAEDDFSKHYLYHGKERIKNSYASLKRILSENGSTRNFFVSGKLFYGSGDMLYIFYENDMVGTSFDKYFSLPEIKSLSSEKLLLNIFEIVIDLAEKVNAVNTTGGGYYFFDITPGNFMVLADASGKAESHNVYLFDVDTLTSTDDIITQACTIPGSENTGFHSSLILKYRNQLREHLDLVKEADAYSVMAVLFYALTKKKLNKNHKALEKCLSSAARIKSCNAFTSEHKKNIVSMLTDVFNKTAVLHLVDRPYTHFSCADLIPALRDIRDFVTRILLNCDETEGSGIRAANNDKNAAELMFSNALYKYPLYDYSKQSAEIKVLILGFGIYGKAAFNAVFSNGQMLMACDNGFEFKNLKIAIVEKDIDFDAFFDDTMPGIKGFADISPEPWDKIHSKHSEERHYADISYLNKNVTANDLETILDMYPADYIVCSMGNTDYNLMIANRISGILGGKAFVGCTVAKKTDVERDMHYAKNVYPIEPISGYEEIYPGLRRLAFNYHILYDKNKYKRTNIRTLKASFDDSKDNLYSFKSNFAAALNLKYKLNSLGIKWNENDLFSVAKRYKKVFSNPSVLPALVDMEHRRWLSNNLVQGFLPPMRSDSKYEYDYSFMFKVNNVRMTEKSAEATGLPLYHTAMVPFSCKNASSIPEDFDWDKDDWENDASYLSGLDELDRVSVLLHHYLRDNRTHYDDVCNNYIGEIRGLLQNDQELYEGAQEFFDIYKMVLEDEKYGGRNYRYESDKLTSLVQEKLRQTSDEVRIKELERVIDLLESIRSMLFVRLEYLSYKDNKSYDRLFMKNIPFTLKYNDFALIQNLRDPDENDILWGLNTPMALDASRIIYLELIDVSQQMNIRSVYSQIKTCISLFGYIMAFKSSKAFFDSASLHIIISGQGAETEKEEYRSLVDECCRKHSVDPKAVHIHCSGRSGELASIVKRIVPSAERLIPVNGFKKSSIFYRLLSELKTRDVFDYSDCIIRKSINIREYMAIYDAAVMSAEQKITETVNYKILWSLFSRNYIYEDIAGYQSVSPESVWNITCNNIYNSLRADTLLCGTIDPSITGEYDQTFSRKYKLKNCYKDIEAFLQAAARYKLITNQFIYESPDSKTVDPEYIVRFNYSLSIYPRDSKDKEKMVNMGDKANETINRIMRIKPFEIVQCDTSNPHYFKYYIMRRSFQLDPGKWDLKDGDTVIEPRFPMRLIQSLVDLGFMTSYKKAQDGKEIAYYQIDNKCYLDLLSKGGTILEYFIYFAMKHSGKISQLYQSVTFRWDKNDLSSANNELDVCGIEGMKAMFVSAKACKKIEKEMINEIYTYATQFDAIPILVSGSSKADTKAVELAVKDMDGMNLICADEFRSESITKSEQSLKDRLRESAEADEKLLAERLIDIFEHS